MCPGSQWFEESLELRYLTFTPLLPLLVVCMVFFLFPVMLRHQTALKRVCIPGLDLSETHHLKDLRGHYIFLDLTIECWSEPWYTFLRNKVPRV